MLTTRPSIILRESSMQLASWQILDAATTQRKRLLQAGYLPIPTEGKKPPIAGWQNLSRRPKAISMAGFINIRRPLTPGF